MSNMDTKKIIKVCHPDSGCFFCARGFWGYYVEEEERAFFEFSFPEDMQGPPGYAHGGAIALILDEVMSFSTKKYFPALLSEIQVKYKRSVPLKEKLMVEGRVVEIIGRKIVTYGAIKTSGGEVLASASGIYVRPRNLPETSLKIITDD